jgi:hypothetical protein
VPCPQAFGHDSPCPKTKLFLATAICVRPKRADTRVYRLSFFNGASCKIHRNECSRRLQPAPPQAGSLCHWVLIEQTEKFAGTKRVLQEPQWETDIRPREKLKEAGDPDASYPGEIHQKVPRLPRATELDSFPEGISGPPSGTFRGPPSLLRRRSRHLSPRPAISARPAL